MTEKRRLQSCPKSRLRGRMRGIERMNEKLQQIDSKMKKTCEHLEAEFSTIRAGRANPHVLDKIKGSAPDAPIPMCLIRSK